MPFPYVPPTFNVLTMRVWVQQNRPLTIDLNDSQYSWLSSLMRACPRDFDGVPIRFLDAPPSVVQ